MGHGQSEGRQTQRAVGRPGQESSPSEALGYASHVLPEGGAKGSIVPLQR